MDGAEQRAIDRNNPAGRGESRGQRINPLLTGSEAESTEEGRLRPLPCAPQPGPKECGIIEIFRSSGGPFVGKQ